VDRIGVIDQRLRMCVFLTRALYRFVAQNRNKRDIPQVNKQNQQL